MGNRPPLTTYPERVTVHRRRREPTKTTPCMSIKDDKAAQSLARNLRIVMNARGESRSHLMNVLDCTYGVAGYKMNGDTYISQEELQILNATFGLDLREFKEGDPVPGKYDPGKLVQDKKIINTISEKPIPIPDDLMGLIPPNNPTTKVEKLEEQEEEEEEQGQESVFNQSTPDEPIQPDDEERSLQKIIEYTVASEVLQEVKLKLFKSALTGKILNLEDYLISVLLAKAIRMREIETGEDMDVPDHEGFSDTLMDEYEQWKKKLFPDDDELFRIVLANRKKLTVSTLARSVISKNNIRFVQHLIDLCKERPNDNIDIEALIAHLNKLKGELDAMIAPLNEYLNPKK